MLQQKLNILVIDDDELDRMALMRSVRKSGYNADVTTAANEKEGLIALQENEFDCIFLDYNLPESTGIDFMRSNRNKMKGAQVIMITSQGDEKLAVEAMKLGVCDYMPKNMINPDGIAQSLRYALRIRKADHDNRLIRSALQETEKKLDAVIERSFILLFAMNSRREYTMFKGHCARILKIDPEMMLGKTISSTYHLFPLSTQLFNELESKEQFTETIQAGDYHLEVTCFRQKNEKGDGYSVMGIATDVTELKKNEQKLISDLTVARDTEKIKQQFIANMSHEIRTPIHGIMSLTNLLMRSNNDPDQLSSLNAIKKSADNLLIIVNDILDLAKIEEEKMTFESTVFQIRELIDASCELFRPRANEKGITLNRRYSDTIPAYVKGDPTRLSQILNNLVNNAVKFTEKGEITVDVEAVESNKAFTMIQFKITDSGIGIPADKLSTIFEKFAQAGDDITRKFGGTGLGLSIAKNLTELQGGIMTVESTYGYGTTFCFSIPFEAPAEHEVPVAETIQDNDSPMFGQGVRVLVVEDNDINRLVISKMMNEWQMLSDNAVNGEEALRMIQSNEYDLVLLDIEMPVMNGYECIERIRKMLHASKRNIPVMAMTAHASKTERNKCLSMGMNDYISKPFDPRELNRKMADMYEGRDLTMTVQVEKLTNLDYLKMLSDNSESFFREFIELFLKNTPETLDDLKKQLHNKNWEGVRQAAHKVKPSLNYMGMKDASKLAADIEMCAKELTHLNLMVSKVNRLCAICDTAFAELQEEINKLHS